MISDEILEVIMPLAEGNPGAVEVLIELHQRLLSIPRFFTIKDFADFLYKQEITGSNIWVCYSDICNNNIDDFIADIVNGELKLHLIETPDYKYYMECKNGKINNRITPA